MKIAIFGLGYVGVVSAACLAELGHQVTGVDINPEKVGIINQGRSPIVESQIDDLVNKGVAAGRMKATVTAEEALSRARLVIICVGTPNEQDGSLSMQSLERTCEMIGGALDTMLDYPIIVVRSTVIPGTTQKVIIPLLEKCSGKKAGIDFGVCFNPEFLREGSSIYDFYNPPQTVIGTDDERVFRIVSEIYEPMPVPIVKTEVEVAEMIKMVSNAYHGLKVTFANEIGNICKQNGIDSHHVMDVFCNDKKLNISTAYLRPGFAFGGSCLPKDINGLLYMGRLANIELPVIQSIIRSNEAHIQDAINLIVRTKKKKIGVLGLSFKEGTDDLRSSAQVELVERLIGKGYALRIFDRNVSIAHLFGANKDYIQKEIPHVSTLMCETIDELLETSEVVVIANRDEDFASVLGKLRPDQIIVDLVRIKSDLRDLNGQYRGLGW